MAEKPDSRLKKTGGIAERWLGMTKGRWGKFSHVILQLTLIFVLFIQVNYLSCRRYDNRDLSRNGKFTLSEQSQGYLENFGDNVQVIMAFLGTSDLFSDVKGLLSEYDRLGGDNLTTEVLDLSRNRNRVAELQDQYNLQFNRNQVIILAENGRVKTINAEEMVTRDASNNRVIEFSGEEVLTSALLEVTEQQQKKIYIMTGDRRADELMQIAGQLQPAVLAQNARLESLVLEGLVEIPADADALLFSGNTEDLTQREVDIVRSYWEEKNGGILVMLDPRAKTPNFNAFLREHGIGPQRDRVMSILPIPGQKPQKIYNVPANLIPGNGPTMDLPAMSLQLRGQTQSLSVLFEDDLLISQNIRPMPLMVAGDGFWGETEYNNVDVAFNPDYDNGPPDPVLTAASVERGIEGDMAFENGSSRMVVIANANLIAPDQNTNKVAKDFVMASLNWVMARDSLLGIPPRQPTAFMLNLSREKFGLMQMVIVFVLPAVFLILGSLVWYRRRA
ncbi:MAG: Gldg family protein [Verrucomicrobiota bacterium]